MACRSLNNLVSTVYLLKSDSLCCETLLFLLVSIGVKSGSNIFCHFTVKISTQETAKLLKACQCRLTESVRWYCCLYDSLPRRTKDTEFSERVQGGNGIQPRGAYVGRLFCPALKYGCLVQVQTFFLYVPCRLVGASLLNPSWPFSTCPLLNCLQRFFIWANSLKKEPISYAIHYFFITIQIIQKCALQFVLFYMWWVICKNSDTGLAVCHCY